MTLSFANLETEVYDHCGLDSSDSNNTTRVDRWLNYVQNDLCARWPWPFMKGSEQIVTVSDYTTGTVTIASGATSGTGSGTTFTAAQTGYYIQFSGTNDWYKFTRVSATSFTIDQPYQPSTSASAVTFILRKFYYSLSSSADRIISIVNWNTPLKLTEVDIATVNALNPNPESTNTTYAYTPWGYDSSGNIQIIPYPFPSDNRVLQIKTMTRPVDGAISIPNKYAHLMAWGAVAIGFAYLRKFDMAQAWSAKFESRLQEMRSEFKQTEDKVSILKSIDYVQRSKYIQMPGSWPPVTGG